MPTEVYDNPLDVEAATAEGLEMPALVFFPDEATVTLGSRAIIEIFAMEVENLAGSHIQLSYDKNKLSLVSSDPGNFFINADETLFISEYNPESGTIDVYVSFLGSDTVSVSGTGSLASLVFTTEAAGQSNLTYSSACELVDPDDNPIEIKGFGEGVINAE